MISRAHSAQSARAQVNAVIARLPKMSPHKLREWHRKARRILVRRPDDVEARRLLEAIEAERNSRPQEHRRISTGRLAWEPHAPGVSQFRGWDGEKPVAVIHKLANHGASRKALYALEVEGVRHPRTFDRIDNARTMGESLYAEKKTAHASPRSQRGETASAYRRVTENRVSAL